MPRTRAWGFGIRNPVWCGVRSSEDRCGQVYGDEDIATARSVRGGLAEGGPEEEGYGEDDGGVGDVEGGPVVLADVEVEEVNDVAVEDAVGDVAEDAGEDESGGQAGEVVGGLFKEEDKHDDGHDGAEDEVEVEPAAHQAEGGAGVGDVDEVEEARDEGDFVVDELKGRPLGQLVEDVEGESDQEEESEWGHGFGNGRRRGRRR